MSLLRIAPLLAVCLVACESSGGGQTAPDSDAGPQDVTAVDVVSSDGDSVSGMDTVAGVDSAIEQDVGGGEPQPPPLRA